ncbi:MAG: hypothetical protein J6P58_00320 [Oscillospiraceae bacterium]|nr:hypothetical protein [Oscillospiraceae bacterium]
MAERQKQRPEPAGASVAPNRLVLLVTIVQKGKGTFFADFLQTFDANLQISVVGTGTAQSDLVEFLGLKDNKRSVIFSVVREDRVDKIFEALQERFQTVNNGTGISFTIPLTSVIGKLSYGFLSNERRVVKGDE